MGVGYLNIGRDPVYLHLGYTIFAQDALTIKNAAVHDHG
jgi:hypothetical protein